LLLQPTHPKENIFFQKINAIINAIRTKYHGLLQKVLRHKKIVLAVFLGFLGVTFLLFKAVPSGFIPNEDQGFFLVNIQGPEGTSLNYTQKILDQVSQKMAYVKDVDGTFAIADLVLLVPVRIRAWYLFP